MRTDYEYIVLGLGGWGSAAAYWLSRRAGADVLGLEQFELGHLRGESQDHSRIIRLSYHTPGYVEAKELPDGQVPKPTEDGNFILGPTHPKAPEMSAQDGVRPTRRWSAPCWRSSTASPRSSTPSATHASSPTPTTPR